MLKMNLNSIIVFSNLNAPIKNKWNLPAAINFYNSKVTFEKCHFNLLNGEFAINFLHSNFEIQNSHFKNVDKSALVSKFSNGIINNSRFHECGNNALNIIQSDIKIDNIEIENVRNNALKIIESSNLSVNNLQINGCNTAVTVKDLSDVKSLIQNSIT